MQITRKNHFVPCFYLCNFADGKKYLQKYPLFVSNSRRNPWQKRHISEVAYHFDLYTFGGGPYDDDELEQWFCASFETDAATAVRRAIEGAKLKPSDYHVLADFVALQLVRTPAQFMRSLSRWEKDIPVVLDEVMERARGCIVSGDRADEDGQIPPEKWTHMPLQIRLQDSENGGMVDLVVEATIGRALWIHEMKHLLTGTKDVFRDSRWTILNAPLGISWPTSDDPVLPLNYQNSRNYDFGAGWKSLGSEFMLPLSPNRLLYTRIGKSVPARGTELSVAHAMKIKELIVEHASREVYSPTKDGEVEQMRHQVIDPNLVRRELEGWASWHAMQAKSEQSIFHKRPFSESSLRE